MGFDQEFRRYVEVKLSVVLPIRTKAMFGGVGIYGNDLFFALIAENKLYFKVGNLNRSDFETAGMEPFFPYDSPSPMGYYELPPDLLDRPEELKVWIDKALAVAETKRKKSKDAH